MNYQHKSLKRTISIPNTHLGGQIRRGPNNRSARVQDLDPWVMVQADHTLTLRARAAGPQRRPVVIRHQIPIALEVEIAAVGRAAGPAGGNRVPAGPFDHGAVRPGGV